MAMLTTSLGRELRSRLPVVNDFDRWPICAACGQGVSDLGCHPELEVGFCPGCYDKVMEGKLVIDYPKDAEGWELYCRLCGDAGHTVGCDACSKVNCEYCIRRNLGNAAFSVISKPGARYECFSCAPHGLDPARSRQVETICRPCTVQELNNRLWPEWVTSGCEVEVKSYGIWCQGKLRAIYKDHAVCKYRAKGEMYQDKFRPDEIRQPGRSQTVAQELKPRNSKPVYRSGAASHNSLPGLQVARKSMPEVHVPAPLQPYGHATPPGKLQVARKSMSDAYHQPKRQAKTKPKAAQNNRRKTQPPPASHYEPPSPSYSNAAGSNGHGSSFNRGFRPRASEPGPPQSFGGHHAPPPKVSRKQVQLEQNTISPTPYQGMSSLSVDSEEHVAKRARRDTGHDIHTPQTRRPADFGNVARGSQFQVSKKSVSFSEQPKFDRDRSRDSSKSFYSVSSKGEPEAEQTVEVSNPFDLHVDASQDATPFRSEPEILLKDISEGKEAFEIPVIVDPHYSQTEVDLARELIEKTPRLLYQRNAVWGVNAGVVVPAQSLDSCVGCDGTHCGRATTKAELQARQRIFPEDWVSSVKCSWGAYDASGRLLNLDGAIWECNVFCQCNIKKCRNRVVQRGITKRLEVFWAGKNKGFGVRSTQKLLCGDFVCEYVGEILTSHEADERGLTCGDAYLFDLTTAQNWDHRDWLDVAVKAEKGASSQHSVPKSARKSYSQAGPPSELSQPGPEESQSQAGTPKPKPGEEELVIDANWLGNVRYLDDTNKKHKCPDKVGRYINHSCSPNLLKSFVWTSIQDKRAPRIAFFAAQDIEPYTELTYDYAYGVVEGKTLKCHCGSANCRGSLY